MTRFELATPRPPDECATGLRYIPRFKKNRVLPDKNSLRSQNLDFDSKLMASSLVSNSPQIINQNEA